MVLDSLLELVNMLRERIDEHGAALRQSEALTRAALIDPLLRELGWDTENPALVMPEYRLGRGYADYALLSNGKPLIMVEAKKLGTPLQDAASQGIGYCIEDGIGYFAVTDGRQWEIYETHKMAPIAEKLTVQFDIARSLPIACLKAMALWRPAVEHGSVTAAETPLVGLDGIKRDAVEPVLSIQKTAAATKSGQTGHEWIPLSELAPEPRSKPTEILLPDDSRVSTNSWTQLIVEVALWLHTNGYLNASNCHVQQSTRYLISNTPEHPNGKGFTQSKKVGSLYVETNFSAPNLVKNARLIINHVDQDPSQFKVRLP